MSKFEEYKFLVGNQVMPHAVNTEVQRSGELAQFMFACLHRHRLGDWGDCSKEDKQLNDYALDNEGRLFSAYKIPKALSQKIRHQKLWIITERDRSQTTILFPSDY